MIDQDLMVKMCTEAAEEVRKNGDPDVRPSNFQRAFIKVWDAVENKDLDELLPYVVWNKNSMSGKLFQHMTGLNIARLSAKAAEKAILSLWPEETKAYLKRQKEKENAEKERKQAEKEQAKREKEQEQREALEYITTSPKAVQAVIDFANSVGGMTKGRILKFFSGEQISYYSMEDKDKIIVRGRADFIYDIMYKNKESLVEIRDTEIEFTIRTWRVKKMEANFARFLIDNEDIYKE